MAVDAEDYNCQCAEREREGETIGKLGFDGRKGIGENKRGDFDQRTLYMQMNLRKKNVPDSNGLLHGLLAQGRPRVKEIPYKLYTQNSFESFILYFIREGLDFLMLGLFAQCFFI